MVEQPAGVVTLFFSDIEGSTRLLHELGPERYREALAEHRRVMREAFARHGGYEVDYEGDAFFVAFGDPAEAVAAASEAQAVLEGGPIVVRMGLHTGEPLLDPPKYVGVDVHLAARIMSAGHGGQVLLSMATRELVDAEASELGEHRLKDIELPVPLFQLGSELFPPLKTISNTNLPRPASSFVGREAEVAEVVALVRESRLVTLTGPGGTGKTRLAIEAAAELVPEFKAGLFWVGLAALRDPALVMETISQTLGAKGELAAHVGEREMLLLLDNFEQVVDAAPELSALLERCHNLRLLVTSRELLRIRGEIRYPVPQLADSDAVELFCARSGLEPDATVAELCRRLDDLPLAVELAAARSRVLTPAQILDRLGQRLDLLKGGRDADPRQQTLRATIEWSHDLLSPGEQQLFARLGVFAGGCTLEAAEEVCDVDLDALQSLVDKSLLRRTGNRFWMLETIREYARERLTNPAEMIERHVRWVLGLVERAAPELIGADQADWFGLLDIEQDNIRAALDSAAAVEAGLEARIVVAVGRYWYVHGSLVEGMRRLDGALAGDAVDPNLRSKLLEVATTIAQNLGEPARARVLAGELLALARRRADPALLARALQAAAIATTDEPETSTRHLEELLSLAEAQNDVRLAFLATHNLANALLSAGEIPRAVRLLTDNLPAARTLGDPFSLAVSLNTLASAELILGKAEDARAHYREALEVGHRMGSAGNVAIALLGFAALATEVHPERAVELLAASDSIARERAQLLDGHELERWERTLADLRGRLSETVFEAAWAAGAALSEADAVALVLAA